jgi:dUTP pyrophosphatase
MGLKEQLAGFLTEEEINNILSQGYVNFEDDETEVDVESELKDFGVDLVELEKSFNEYTPKLELGYNKLSNDAVDPKYNYPSDSGFDLHSTKDLEIEPFGRVLVPTGLSLDISDGYEIQVRSKSGLAIKQGLMVLNSPGTVDNGYTGEVQVIVFNTNNYNVLIHKGMKVGQAVLCPVVNGKWVNLIEKSKINEKERGENGFGSTGI